MNPPRAIVFDADGTLIDSNDAHASAWVEAFRSFGINASFRRVRPLIDHGAAKLIPDLTGGIPEHSPAGVRIIQARDQIFRTEHLSGLKAMPGSRPLLQRVRRDGMRVAVTSSASPEDLDRMLHAAGIHGLVNVRVSADTPGRSRLAPDAVLLALASLKLTATDVMMVGDAAQDVAGAMRAGIPVIALRCGGWNDASIERAAAIYDDPADLLARYDESPLAHAATRGR